MRYDEPAWEPVGVVLWFYEERGEAGFPKTELHRRGRKAQAAKLHRLHDRLASRLGVASKSERDVGWVGEGMRVCGVPSEERGVREVAPPPRHSRSHA